MPHPLARANPTAAVAVVLLLQVPLIPAVGTVPDMTGDVPHTAPITTGAALHHQAATIATEVLPVAVVPLPPPVETVMDRRHTVEAVPLLLTTATVVVMVLTHLLVVAAVRTVELQILIVGTVVDLLPSLPAQAVATFRDLPVVEMNPVDPPPILLH